MPAGDPFSARRLLDTPDGPVAWFDIAALERSGEAEVAHRPFVEKILLENLVRNAGVGPVRTDHALALALGEAGRRHMALPVFLSRVVLQDGSGLPALMDLAAQRAALARLGKDPELARPALPAELIVDHSAHTDVAGAPDAARRNLANEYGRNHERFRFLKWAQRAIDGLRVVPPGNGIIHQINLEYLSGVVAVRKNRGETIVSPETLVGTDSHTTMINALGVLGWGVGGIEAQSALLGEPRYIQAPTVIGVRLEGALREGATPTDLALTLAERFRQHGVNGACLEFCGPGLDRLPLPDRATIANMAPEYGAAIAFFPVDDETLAYLRLTGRDPRQVELVARYTEAAGLFRRPDAPLPQFTETIEVDLSAVEPSLAGPKRPHDRTALGSMAEAFSGHLTRPVAEHGFGLPEDALEQARAVRLENDTVEIRHGSVVIAAITSCVNTSNPTLMIGAGLVARKAVEKGLRTQPWVRTSLAPGSKAVARYLRDAGLMEPLEALGFHIVGFGCMSCGGKTGPIAPPIVTAIEEEGLVACSVLSGNRNFEGRISPYARASYLASPMLVVVYALAGRIDIDFDSEPIGEIGDGRPVYLRDIWPTAHEIQEALGGALHGGAFRDSYDGVFDGGPEWDALDAPDGPLFPWDADSQFMREPPYFQRAPLRMTEEPARLENARALLRLGDSVTTDHIYPGSMIDPDSAAGRYLIDQGVRREGLNSFTAGRGNHDVVLRGAFANRRTRNLLMPEGTPGGWTRKFPEDAAMFVHEAAERYRAEGTPMIVLAGRDYGMGSARDFAAKAPLLLGVRAIIAESFAPTHRWNLVGMGIVPLRFAPGEGCAALGLTGEESFTIEGWGSAFEPGAPCRVIAAHPGRTVRFEVTPEIESDLEMAYLAHGGILPLMLARAASE